MDPIELIEKRNNALRLNTNTVNGRTADIAITTRGSDLYFAISAFMGFMGFLFLILSYTKPRRDRLFHYITAGILFVASIAYFTMGSNLGFTPIEVEFPRSRANVRGRYREIFYVRYIDWFITTPLLLADLLLTAGLPWPKIAWVVLVDWVMIVMGLVGALVRSRYKWAYFAVGCAALFYILYELLWTARRHARLLGPDVNRCFQTCGVLTLFIWLLYPIAWGVCEGGNYIAPDSEAIFYSVLDFIAKPIFGILLLWGHRKIDPARLGVQIRDYDEDPSVYGGMHSVIREKPEGKVAGTVDGVNGVNGVHGASGVNGVNGVNGVHNTSALNGSGARPTTGRLRSGVYQNPTPPTDPTSDYVPPYPPPPQIQPQPNANYSAPPPPAPPPPHTHPDGVHVIPVVGSTPAGSRSGTDTSTRRAREQPPAVHVTEDTPEIDSVPVVAVGTSEETPRTREEAIRGATHGAVGGGEHAL